MPQLCGAPDPSRPGVTCTKRQRFHSQHSADGLAWESPTAHAAIVTSVATRPGASDADVGRGVAQLAGVARGESRPPEPRVPVLPYHGGTDSGYAGSATSEARAHYLDESGITAVTQRCVWTLISEVGERGYTVKELRTHPRVHAMVEDVHHGKVSGALSNLQERGHLSRLRESRDGCQIYVLPEHVNGRDEAGHLH